MRTEAPDPPSKRGARLDLRGAMTVVLAAASVLAVALVLTSLAQRLDWRLDLLSHFRWHLAAALLLAAGTQLVIRPWRLAAGYALTAVATVSIALAARPAAPPTSGAAGSPALTLIHANISREQFRQDAFLDWATTVEPDLVLMQEVTGASLAGLLPAMPAFEVVAAEPRPDTRGVAVLARRGLGATGEIVRLRPTGARPFAEVSVRLGPRRLRLLHFHTTRPAPGRYFRWQGDDFRDAGRWVARVREAGETPALIGDFNQTPQGWRLLVPEGLAVPSLAVGPLVGGDHRPIAARLAVAGG